MVLTKEQKELLTIIVNDKFSVGAFSDMIFNAQVAHNMPTDMLIRRALDVRLEMNKMVENEN
jgi:hypothetical protein